MTERAQDPDAANAAPLENALQGEPEEQARSQTQAPGGGPTLSGQAPTGRATFTTPGAVSSIHDMAANAEKYSDPIAGEAEAGAQKLEEAKRRM
jgi:hypothetical protein